MLMYMFHIALALGLIALVVGLKYCKCCSKGHCETTGNGNKEGHCCYKWIGCIIVILATLSVLCTLHAGYKHYTMGTFGPGMVINLDMIDATPANQAAAGQADHAAKKAH